ncbi:MAG: hypothetical protein J7J42_05065 [Thermoplasmata archaeon]|nr:hypothetical protein [Thermoplasmata archaeon]
MIKIADNRIEISRDRIIVDIYAPHKLKNMLAGSMGSLRDGLKMLNEAGKMLKAKKKTLILKYDGEDVAVMGYNASPGIFGKVEIKSKISLMKLLAAFMQGQE